VPRHPSFLLKIFYISLSLSLSLTGEEYVRTLFTVFTGQRERKRKGKREKEGERE
jgi:hypothetical protein